MPQNARRQFIRSAATVGAAAMFLPSALASAAVPSAPSRKFRICLNPGAIGVQADQNELLELAHQHGFEAIIAFPAQLASINEQAIADYVAKMHEYSITWGAAGLPVQFRESEEQFREDMKALPVLASSMELAGVTRCNTWVMPTHPTLSYLDNFKLHKERLKLVARVLGHHGVKLGLEYVGPQTLMIRDRFPFIHSMHETRLLLNEINEDNMGFVLDSFHWYCAGETLADILSLDPDEVVTVDLNDARAGLSREEQIDGQRELPAATGVIDIHGFVEALVQIGYDGPVRAEPFNRELNEMDNDAAATATKQAMWKAIGEA